MEEEKTMNPVVGLDVAKGESQVQAVFCKQKIQRIAAKNVETCKLSFNLIFVV
ncbi:hypothetical protein RCO48_39435 [Peribacillus frigoritolerans]|nr:hypothetical protein [Peribacillus frigoritolerans]MDQ7864980.1 hypothetical protein [Peribacillus frigoritolerans]